MQAPHAAKQFETAPEEVHKILRERAKRLSEDPQAGTDITPDRFPGRPSSGGSGGSIPWRTDGRSTSRTLGGRSTPSALMARTGSFWSSRSPATRTTISCWGTAEGLGLGHVIHAPSRAASCPAIYGWLPSDIFGWLPSDPNGVGRGTGLGSAGMCRHGRSLHCSSYGHTSKVLNLAPSATSHRTVHQPTRPPAPMEAMASIPRPGVPHARVGRGGDKFYIGGSTTVTPYAVDRGQGGPRRDA